MSNVVLLVLSCASLSFIHVFLSIQCYLLVNLSVYRVFLLKLSTVVVDRHCSGRFNILTLCPKRLSPQILLFLLNSCRYIVQLYHFLTSNSILSYVTPFLPFPGKIPYVWRLLFAKSSPVCSSYRALTVHCLLYNRVSLLSVSCFECVRDHDSTSDNRSIFH